MKIGWLTPFSDKSAIGYYSKLACEELSKIYDVTIITPKFENYYKTDLSVRILHSIEDNLSQYDILFFNIGDNHIYHSMIFDMAKQYAGIIILHDLSLINFVYGYYIEYKKDFNEYCKILENLYGSENADNILKASKNMHSWNKIDSVKFNFIPLIIKNAKGVIIHSHYHYKILYEYYKGPSQLLYFPYPLKKDLNRLNIQNKERVNLLTVGMVNPNKRIAEVIEAIGTDDELKNKIVYTVVGSLHNEEYYAYLRKNIKKYRLENNVFLAGEASSEKLNKLYNNADILVNLRNPAIEGASWSLVEQMEMGKPILVTKIGFYEEIPNDCVIKIDNNKEQEIKMIQKQLKWIINNPKKASIIGENARNFLIEYFSPRLYVTKLDTFIKKIHFFHYLENVVDDIGCELRMLNVFSNMKICNVIAEELEDLFL